jgi:hypothetical protein
VKAVIGLAIGTLRERRIAVTQADVVGHSLGALLVRLYAGDSQYKRPDNLGLGDIHRLVTLDTPHFGSSFANLVIALHRVQPQLTTDVVRKITDGGRIDRGAVCDLAENSPALATLPDRAPIPTLAITGTGGPAPTANAPASYYVGPSLLLGQPNFEKQLTDLRFPQDTVNNFRFRQPNDAIVALSSQQGGLLGSINFQDLIHFGRAFWIIGSPVPGITFSSDVANQVFQSLDGPDSGFNPNTPAVTSTGTGETRTVPGRGVTLNQQDYAAECSPGGPLKPAVQAAVPQGVGSSRPSTSLTTLASDIPADPRLRIVSPVQGQVFTVGQTVTVVVQVDPSLSAVRYLLSAPGLDTPDTYSFDGSTYTAQYTLPPQVTGPVVLTPSVVDAAKNTTFGADVTIGIRPSTPPQKIAISEERFSVPKPSTRVENTSVQGTYADGSQLDLTSSVTGTTYQSSNPSVVKVNAEGAFQAVGSGTAVITAQNGGARAFATVTVGIPGGIVTEDVTSKVTITRSGFRLDRQTGFFVQDVSVTNSQALPIESPLYLVLSGLPSGVVPVNLRGRSRNFIPGSPYAVLQTTVGIAPPLAPGESTKLQLQFLNPSRVPITYVPKVIFSQSDP